MPSEISIQCGGASRPPRAVLAGDPVKGRPGLIIIHEWWGLNHETKLQAEKYAALGYTAVAVDLYQEEVADQPQEAMRLMNALSRAYAYGVLQAWATWLRNEMECPAVGVVGYSLGGSWALNLTARGGMDAAVIYYGSLDADMATIQNVGCPVLAHIGAKDQIYPAAHAAPFTRAMLNAGKDVAVHIYDADHGFARIGGAEFEPASVETAWSRTVGFLHEHLCKNVGCTP